MLLVKPNVISMFYPGLQVYTEGDILKCKDKIWVEFVENQ